MMPIEHAISIVLRFMSIAHQSTRPADMNASESLPSAAVQKLMDGRKTTSVAKRRISRDLSAVAARKLASKASRPMLPKMLNNRHAPRNDKLRPVTKIVAMLMTAAVPTEKDNSPLDAFM